MMKETKDFPSQFLRRLWHTTSPARYQMIKEAGHILPDPPIADQKRWGTITGSILYWCVFATISFTAAIILPAGFPGFGAAFVWVCSKGVGASVPTSTIYRVDL
jgi:hypothetical protein